MKSRLGVLHGFFIFSNAAGLNAPYFRDGFSGHLKLKNPPPWAVVVI
jgi:hypothetical protein